MKVFIPNDWSGQRWQCIQMYWPKSTLWDAILIGLMELPSKGRFWNENTGNIRTAQSVGDEIWSKNYPLNVCPVETNEDSQVKMVSIFGNWLTELEVMAMLCGYNPDAFRFNNGVLEIKNFCGEWEAVTTMGETDDTPPVDFWGDYEPPAGFSACGKADAWVSALWAIGSAMWEYYDDESEYELQLRAALPMAELGRLAIYLSIPQMHVLAALLTESTVMSTDLFQKMRCRGVVGLANTGTFTDAEFEYMNNAVHSVLSEEFGSSPTTLELIKGFFYRIGEIIGEGDMRNIVQIGAKNTEADCECPEEPVIPEAEYGDWYLKALPQVTYPFDDVKEHGYCMFTHVDEHDVYGLFIEADLQSLNGTFLRWSKASAAAIPNIDVDMTYHSSSLDIDLDEMHVQFDDTPASGLYDALGTEKSKELSVLGPRSTNVSAPILDAGDVGGFNLFAQTSGAGNGTIKYRVYLVQNTGSPSHV